MFILGNMKSPFRLNAINCWDVSHWFLLLISYVNIEKIWNPCYLVLGSTNHPWSWTTDTKNRTGPCKWNIQKIQIGETNSAVWIVWLFKRITFPCKEISTGFQMKQLYKSLLFFVWRSINAVPMVSEKYVKLELTSIHNGLQVQSWQCMA
jgi:hypothetical protein